MKLQGSIIAIRSTEKSVWENYLDSFHYVETGIVNDFDQFETFQEYLNQEYFKLSEQDIFLRGIWNDEVATYIFDPEMTDSVEHKELFKFAKLQNSTIHSFLFERQSKAIRITQNSHQEMHEIHLLNDKILSKRGKYETLDESTLINQDVLFRNVIHEKKFEITPINKMNFKTYNLKWTNEYQEYFKRNIDITTEDLVEMSIPKSEKNKPKWKFW